MSLRFDWSNLLKRISTWLAGASLALNAAALYFVAAPPEWKAGFPAWAGFAMLAAGMACAAAVPVATSFKQKTIPAPHAGDDPA